MCLSKSFFIYSLLLTVSVVGDDCIKKNCDKAWAIPSNENLTIKVSPCDKCTNCDSPFETQNIVTVRAWWCYKLPNGSRTEEINARVIDNRDYEIKVRYFTKLSKLKLSPRCGTVYT